MARYAMEEAYAALQPFAYSKSEEAAIEHYEDQLRDVEIICAKDNCHCARLKLTSHMRKYL